ncbi:MAG: histidine phosphatase family protein [Alphaproteobacteria bacterium]|nr:histidine phosphatase family protein [Alphaproteobacteria bacterium]
MTASPSPRRRAPQERSLTLLRHAKSSWEDGSIGDHERPLNARGRHAGRLIAALLAQRETPDLVLCSDALRTRQTFEHVSAGLSGRVRVLYERDLYLADAETLLRRIAAVPNEVRRLLVIGHNPGMHELAASLAAMTPKGARGALDTKFPTGAVARYRFAGPWRDIRDAALVLTEFTTPADLEKDPPG